MELSPFQRLEHHRLARISFLTAQFLLHDPVIRRLPSDRTICIEGINGSGKTTLSLGLIKVLRHIHKDKKVIGVKGSGSDPSDILTLLDDVVVTYPEMKSDLTPRYEAIATAQMHYRNTKNERYALEIFVNMWSLINYLAGQEDVIMVMDRSPWSATLAGLQRWGKRKSSNFFNVLRYVGEQCNGIPVPSRQILVDISPEDALARLGCKGECHDGNIHEQLQLEDQCFQLSMESINNAQPYSIQTVNGLQREQHLLSEALNILKLTLPKDTTTDGIFLEVQETRDQAQDRINEFFK